MGGMPVKRSRYELENLKCKVMMLRKKKYSMRQIAEELGVSKSYVHKILNEDPQRRFANLSHIAELERKLSELEKRLENLERSVRIIYTLLLSKDESD